MRGLRLHRSFRALAACMTSIAMAVAVCMPSVAANAADTQSQHDQQSAQTTPQAQSPRQAGQSTPTNQASSDPKPEESAQSTPSATSTSEASEHGKRSDPSAQSDEDDLQPKSVSTDDDLATLTISRSSMGNVPNPGNLTLTLNLLANAGDTYTVTIPASTSFNGVYHIQEPTKLPPQLGTTNVTTNQDGSRTVTLTFTADATASLSLDTTLEALNNYWAQSKPMDIIGTTTRTITWSRTLSGQKREKLPDLSFTQVVTPGIDPQQVQRVSPSAQTAEQIRTRKDVTYRLQIDETDGVQTDTAYPSSRVNSAVNGGTTITIPVPAHFTLDEQATMSRNAFAGNDKTTITQPKGPGTPIVISVPKGSGSQNWEQAEGYEGYFFVGQYDMDQPDAITPVKADAPITIDQTVTRGDGSTYTITKTVPALADTLKSSSDVVLCSNGTQNCLQLAVAGNNTGNKMILADASKLTTLNFVGFANTSANDLTASTITINMPDGFDAKAVVTPKDPVNLPGLTSYKYTVTLRNGTVMTGSVPAGETITRNQDSSISKIELKPNLIAAGATTTAFGGGSIASSCTTYVDDNAGCAGKPMIYVQGTLAQTYSNGTPVKVGDMFTTTVTWSDPDAIAKDSSGKQVTFTATAQNMQKVIPDSDLDAYLSVFGWQADGTPGVRNAGYMSVYKSTSTGTSALIYEPIFYYVLPKYTVYDREKGLTVPNQSGDSVGKPKITGTTDSSGREVIKIDYTGTGYWFNTDSGSNQQIWLDNLSNAVRGQYPYSVYIYSPTIKVSGTAPAAVTEFSDGHAVQLVGNGKWNISVANVLMSAALARGNEDAVYRQNGLSNDKRATNDFKDPRRMDFQMVVNNGSSTTLQGVRQFVNVPQAGTNAKRISLRMTGPLTVQTDSGTTQEPYTVKYSTQPAVLATTNAPSDAGYVTADQIGEGDWANIRSVVIEMPTLAASAITPQFTMHTIDPTLAVDAGKQARLGAALYADNLKPIVTNPESNAAANIGVRGHATITARLHYIDSTGTERNVDLPNLTREYADNEGTFSTKDYPQTLDALVQQEGSLVPDGYSLSGMEIVGDTTATYPGGYPAGTAKWNTVAKYYYNGSVVQYNLVPQDSSSTMPITGTTGIWNVATLAALIAIMTLIPVVHWVCGLRRRHE